MNRDPLERVSVAIGGGDFRGWSRISITYSVKEAARSASLSVSDFAGAQKIEPGADAVISASGTVILTGYVRDVRPSHTETDHHVEVTIVSRAVDAVEASIDHETGFVKDKDLVAIAKEFDTSGVGIVASESFPKEARRFVNLGESLFGHIEPLARSHGAMIYDTPEGKLRIAKKPRGRHAGALAIGPGGNIIAASAELSEEGRHDEVIVRGQASRGTGGAALRIEAKAKDRSVRRRRPRIVVHESEATAGKLKERAERNIKRAAGYSRSASVTVVGWRDQGGRIFEQHFIIAVHDPRIYIEQDMAIESVTLTQDMDGQGTRAVLSLVDPAALNGEGGGKGPWKTSDAKGKLKIL